MVSYSITDGLEIATIDKARIPKGLASLPMKFGNVFMYVDIWV